MPGAQTPENRCRTNMLYAAKLRAKKRGVPFDLTYEDIQPGEGCPCCGTRYDYAAGHRFRPSMDRLIPERGYVRDNIVFVCTRCNQRKNDMTPREMYAIADFFWERIKEAIGVGLRGED